MDAAPKKPARGRPRLTDAPPGQTRERLLQAAAEVFAEDGYEGASVSKIARRVGITSGAVYAHFSGKADVLLHLIEREEAGALKQMNDWDDGGELSLSVFADMVTDHGAPEKYSLRRLAVEIQAAAGRDAEVAEKLAGFTSESHDYLVQQLEQCKAQGLVPQSLDSNQTVNVLFILIMGMAHLDTIDPELVGDESLLTFLNRSIITLLKSG